MLYSTIDDCTYTSISESYKYGLSIVRRTQQLLRKTTIFYAIICSFKGQVHSLLLSFDIYSNLYSTLDVAHLNVSIVKLQPKLPL